MKFEAGIYIKEARTVGTERIGFVNAARVHNALTAGMEKRLLLWLADRTPAWIGPDHLTALAFASQLLAGAAYALSSLDSRALWMVSAFLFLNWLGDSLDGTLARVRNRQRPRYGFYVDHIADTFGAMALMAGMACSSYLHWQIAAGMLVCYYAVSIETYLATYTLARFHLSHGLFGPTELRILLVLGNVFVRPDSHVTLGGRNIPLFDFAGSIAIAGMGIMAVTAAIRHTAALYREETLR